MTKTEAARLCAERAVEWMHTGGCGLCPGNFDALARQTPEEDHAPDCPVLAYMRADEDGARERRIAALEAGLDEACDVLEAAANTIEEEGLADDDMANERRRIARLRALVEGAERYTCNGLHQHHCELDAGHAGACGPKETR